VIFAAVESSGAKNVFLNERPFYLKLLFLRAAFDEMPKHEKQPVKK